MEQRALGRTGLEITPFVLGGNVFGWTAKEATSQQLLNMFVASGGNCIDTADVYSTWVPGHTGGESEKIIGKWMKKRGNRQQLIICTKVGAELSPEKKGLKKSYILKACEDSLKRLQTDYIDLYFSHKDDPGTRVEEPLEAYAQLLKEGKIRSIGASNFSAGRLQEALQASEANGLPAYQVLQPAYNLYDRSFEQELLPLAQAHDLGVISYFGLARGFLTGKYRSEADLEQSARGGAVKQYLNARGFRILDALEAVAKRYKTSAAAVALAWCLQRAGITAPIASATKPEQLQDLLDALHLQLDAAAMEQLNHASRPE